MIHQQILFGQQICISVICHMVMIIFHSKFFNMTNTEIFNTIVERLKTESFLSGFKFRKRDSSFLKQDGDLRQSIELDHWSKYGLLIIYPIYGVRFDILLKWFEIYSFKTLQDQRDIPSVGFTGNMIGKRDKFAITEDELERGYAMLRDSLAECTDMVFLAYTSLQDMYNHEIIPLLEGRKELPDVGADWVFRNLTLTRIVSPDDYERVKELILAQVRFMAGRNEPNIIEYMPRLDEIISAMERRF